MAKLDRLTFVHDGESGPVGYLLLEARGVLRFGLEGSGLLDLSGTPGPRGLRPSEPPGVGVPISSVMSSQLSPEARAATEEDIPCIIGHSGENVALLVPSRSLGRVTGGMNDLRGKVRFGLARVGWHL